jgi:hypothetical protein
MKTRELLKQQLDTFNDDQLEQIADFMEFLYFRNQKATHPDDTPNAQILSDFRQAWHEAMTGQGIPASQIWDGLENV